MTLTKAKQAVQGNHRMAVAYKKKKEWAILQRIKEQELTRINYGTLSTIIIIL